MQAKIGETQDRTAERQDGERQPVKTVTTKGGGTITLYWCKTLGCYVTIPASER